MTAGASSESESSDGARLRLEPSELRRVLSHYCLGKVRSIRPLDVGSPDAPKVVIGSERGRYLLKRRAPGRDDPLDVARLHGLQLAMEAKGVPVAQLIGTLENNSMLQLGGQTYELCEFVEGRPCAHDEGDSFESGRVLSVLHGAMVGMSIRGFVEGSYHAAERVEMRLEHVAQAWSDHGRDETLASRVLAMYRRAGEDAERAGVGGHRRQLVHGDWHPGNLVFAEGGRATVVDFDTTRTAQPLTDVAMGVLQFSMPARTSDFPQCLDLGRARGFLRGYGRGGVDDRFRGWIALAPLMVEALIAEVAAPIARTGRFGEIEGETMLASIERLGSWILSHGERLSPSEG